jgi:archaellum biogenesis protein FlaJ (TadC family)
VANKFRDINEKEEVIAEMQTQTSSPEPKAPEQKKVRRRGVLAKALSAVFSGTFLTNERTLQHLPFIIFLAIAAIFYIGNGYYADGKIREVNKVSNQLKELRSEYISTKSELMFASKQSEVAKAMESEGLKEPVIPPIKIEVDSAALYKYSQ